MKKYVNAVLLAALGCTVLSGCGKSEAKPQETTETVAAETNAESDAEPETEAEAVSPEGMARNNLTGEGSRRCRSKETARTYDRKHPRSMAALRY